ncbi:hypothetical protein Hanom_Chr00s019323g01758951 [Helianthus anomalus]
MFFLSNSYVCTCAYVYHFLEKFHNILSVVKKIHFHYTTICNTLLFTLPILEMHMCIYMYQHE